MAKIAPGGVLQLTEVELAAMRRADWKDPYWRKEGQDSPHRQYGPSADIKDAGR